MTSKRNIDRRLDELEGDDDADATNRIEVYDTADTSGEPACIVGGENHD